MFPAYPLLSQARASGRKLSDLTIGPVLTWTTQAMMDHKDKLLKIPGQHGGGGLRMQRYGDLLMQKGKDLCVSP
jgi:hypothetical protein